MHERVEAFADLMMTGSDPHLDDASLAIAACFRPDVDFDSARRDLDALAEAAPSADMAGVVNSVYAQGGFRGDQDDYYAPENSLLDQVLQRRRGMPITLAVVLIEVGRRVGIDVAGVSMPGHFIVAAEGSYYDPFDNGRRLDRDDCVAIFQQVQPSPDTPFDDRWLQPVGSRLIVLRMLANLERSLRFRDDRAGALMALDLQARVPGVLGPRARRRIAETLAEGGQFDRAAAVYEALAEDLPNAGDDLRKRASGLRARLN